MNSAYHNDNENFVIFKNKKLEKSYNPDTPNFLGKFLKCL